MSEEVQEECKDRFLQVLKQLTIQRAPLEKAVHAVGSYNQYLIKGASLDRTFELFSLVPELFYGVDEHVRLDILFNFPDQTSAFSYTQRNVLGHALIKSFKGEKALVSLCEDIRWCLACRDILFIGGYRTSFMHLLRRYPPTSVPDMIQLYTDLITSHKPGCYLKRVAVISGLLMDIFKYVRSTFLDDEIAQIYDEDVMNFHAKFPYTKKVLQKIQPFCPIYTADTLYFACRYSDLGTVRYLMRVVPANSDHLVAAFSHNPRFDVAKTLFRSTPVDEINYKSSDMVSNLLTASDGTNRSLIRRLKYLRGYLTDTNDYADELLLFSTYGFPPLEFVLSDPTLEFSCGAVTLHYPSFSCELWSRIQPSTRWEMVTHLLKDTNISSPYKLIDSVVRGQPILSKDAFMLLNSLKEDSSVMILKRYGYDFTAFNSNTLQWAFVKQKNELAAFLVTEGADPRSIVRLTIHNTKEELAKLMQIWDEVGRTKKKHALLGESLLAMPPGYHPLLKRGGYLFQEEIEPMLASAYL